MATKSNQTGFNNKDILTFPMSLSRDWSLSKDFSLCWLGLSQEWLCNQSTLGFVANEWRVVNPSSTENKTTSKKGGTTDWTAMYNGALASVRAPDSIISVPAPIHNPSPKNPRPKRTRTNRIPKEKVYVDKYTDFDVLFGRGGRSNHHPGNKMYRVQVTEKQPIYRSCKDKKEKTVIAQLVVDHVNKNQKGRFLELDVPCNRWYVVPNNSARTKVGQALRDNNTEEARVAKREKYPPKQKKSSFR